MNKKIKKDQLPKWMLEFIAWRGFKIKDLVTVSLTTPTPISFGKEVKFTWALHVDQYFLLTFKDGSVLNLRVF